MSPKAEHSYQVAAVHSADSVQLVIMLHDMLIEDLRRCIAATRSGAVEARTNYAAHAFEVLGQLQLGIDHEEGSEPACNMNRLYAIARMELLRAQISRDACMFEKQMEIFSSLRDAWKRVQDRRPKLVDGDSPQTSEDTGRADWTI
jgi:flagellar biosynthetic protein FliS